MDFARIVKAGRTLLMGSLVGKAATVLSLPVIARLYMPEDFSDLALLVAILTALGPLLTLRYSQALNIPRSDTVLANLVALCVAVGLGASVLFSLALVGFAITSGEGERGLASGILLASVVAVLPKLIYEICSGLAIRDQKYGLVAKTQASQAIVGSLAKIALGLVGAGAIGLLAGQVIGQFSGIRPLMREYWARLMARRGQVSARRMRAVAAMFWQFPAYRFPSQLLLALASQSPVMFVVYQYDANRSGQFALAMTLVTTAINLVGTNLGRAFLGEAGQIYRHERHRLARYTIRMQALFAAIFTPVAIVAYFVAEPILRLVLGPDWVLASQIAPVLIIYGLANICSAPVIQIFTFMRKQATFLLINAVRLAAVCGLFFAAHSSDMNVLQFSRYYAAVMIAFYVFVALLVISTVVGQRQNDHLPAEQEGPRC